MATVNVTDETSSESGVRTFRGRTVEEILPQVRAELGADAIVLSRREGLSGGVAGFFQRSYAEVDARAATPEDRPRLVPRPETVVRNDRATEEGLASPAIQALVEQASPFAAALTRAEGAVAHRAQDVLLAAARGSVPSPPVEAAPAAPGLYGPQPNYAELEPPAAEAAAHEIAPAPRTAYSVSPASPSPAAPGLNPVSPASPSPAAPGFGDVSRGPDRPTSADTAVKRLVAAGLSTALAEDVVGEAVTHGLPFASPNGLKKLIRTALARRMPVMGDLGAGPRTLAFVGAAGAGKTSAIAALAAAYAEADASVTVVALRSEDGGAGLAAKLEPLGVSVIAAADAEQATRRLTRRDAVLTLVDTPAAGPGDRGGIAALAADLRDLGVEEVHLTLPATLSAAAGDELAAAVAPLGVTHVALTHSDQTARPGAPVELAITGRRALSYACSRDAIEPADPADLARRLLP
jgi:flagellar biosynthesis GTPase FlhF